MGYLQTAIIVKDKKFTHILAALNTTNSPIFVAVREHSIHHCHINSKLFSYINQIHSLPRSSGYKSCGIRKEMSSDQAPSTVALAQSKQSDDSEEDTFNEEDDVERDIGILVEYLSNQALYS